MVIAAFGFIIGLILGSFVKAVADRVALGKSLWGRSYCLHCKRQLAWYDLFPFLSFLLLKGKCRYCQKNIPLENFLTEVFLGLVVALLFVNLISPNLQLLFDYSWRAPLLLLEILFKIFAISVLAIIFFADLKTGLIPDKITYPAAAIAFLYILLSTGLKSWFYYQGLINGPLGKYLTPPHSNYVYEYIGRIWIPAGYTVLSAFLLSGFFALLIMITQGKGMGWGDVKYAFLLGLSLGFPNIIPAIFLAFLIGAAVSLVLIALGKKHFGQTIPFGPFLSLGALVSLFWGTNIVNWYVNVFHF